MGNRKRSINSSPAGDSTSRRELGLLAVSSKQVALGLYDDIDVTGMENVTPENLGWRNASARQEAIAKKSERRMILDYLFLKIIEACPVDGKKRGEGNNIVRLKRVRTELLGERPWRGRPSVVKEARQNMLDAIALLYLDAYFREGVQVELDPILKKVVLSDGLKKKGMSDSEIETSIAPYRRAFNKEFHWLLIRNSQGVDVPPLLWLSVMNAIHAILYLSGKRRKFVIEHAKGLRPNK